MILLLDALLFKDNSLLETLRRRYMCLDCSILVCAWNVIVSCMNFLRGGEGEMVKRSGCLGVEQGAEFSSYGSSLSFLFTFSPTINNFCDLCSFLVKKT